MVKTYDYLCGACMTAKSVRAGTLYRRRDPEGRVHEYTTEDALAELARDCRCTTVRDFGTGREDTGPKPVAEIRREGSRILRAGVPVTVQLKRKPRTWKTPGVVVECYEGGTVKVTLNTGGIVTISADEFVSARNKRAV